MKKVWIAADCVVSPLGVTTGENFSRLVNGESGISLIDDSKLSNEPFYGAKIDSSPDPAITKFESIAVLAMEHVLRDVTVPRDRCIFILSTTKGNISALEEGIPNHPRIHLHAVAAFLARKFGFTKHTVVSNACISGVMALIVGKRMIEAGQYDHAVIVGVDVLSRFVVSGFQSLQALSTEPCRPFDISRKGINLGECAAAIVLTSNPNQLSISPSIRISGGGISNDANHISGPSRTGEELALAIKQALDEALLTERDVDFISAHGTATLYNDEMEAKAFSLLGMERVPMNSLKSIFGHTLGAAGIVEVAVSAKSISENQLVPSKGFEKSGVSRPVNIIQLPIRGPLKTCLKTASGFGGCNAAIVLQKENNF